MPVASIPAFAPFNLPLPARPFEPTDIVIEIRRGTASVTVRWPSAAAVLWVNHSSQIAGEVLDLFGRLVTLP
ncbi:hypothetical protein [Undibacterium curvum]|uniref:hypothetical protein n=1 Tax=Undibacterium curvum TaxID=2762294 RepID=UPI003D108519